MTVVPGLLGGPIALRNAAGARHRHTGPASGARSGGHMTDPGGGNAAGTH